MRKPRGRSTRAADTQCEVPSLASAKAWLARRQIEKYLRNMYAWGSQYEVKLGPAKTSPIPDLLEIPVTVGLQGQSDTAVVYVTKDAKFIFRGELTDMTVDPWPKPVLSSTRATPHQWAQQTPRSL